MNGTATDFARLLPALAGERRAMAWGFVVGVVNNAALLALVVAASWAIGRALVLGAAPPTLWWALMVGLVLLRCVLTWHDMDVSHALAYRVLAALRMALFDAFARSMPSKRREHSGRLASTALTDTEHLEFFYAHTLAQGGSAIAVYLLAVAGAAWVHPPAALVLLGAGLAICVTAAVSAWGLQRVGEEEQAERGRLSALVVDALGALRELLIFGLVPRAVQRCDAVTAVACRAARGRDLRVTAWRGAREVIVTFAVVGVVAVSVGATTPEQVASVPALVALAAAGVAILADAAGTLAQLHPLRAAAQRVAAGLDREAVVAEPVGATGAIPAGPLGLRLSDVAFTYDERGDVLHDFNLTVQPGERVALTGPSGVGKSTVLALAARLWSPRAGRVELVGAELVGAASVAFEALSEAHLRAAVAFVDQDQRLFHGTVRENLVRGASGPIADAELAELLRALRLEGVSLDARVGEAGLSLSGGQRARLCFARALARKPRVLLLDEVTAAVDAETQAAMLAVLDRYDGTVLMSAHRPEVIATCDRVVRLG